MIIFSLARQRNSTACIGCSFAQESKRIGFAYLGLYNQQNLGRTFADSVCGPSASDIVTRTQHLTAPNRSTAKSVKIATA